MDVQLWLNSTVAGNHSRFTSVNETCMEMPNMRLLPLLAWELSEDPPAPLDPRLLPLLRAVAETGSLAAAVADRGLSYRAAWGLLRTYKRKLGDPLVMLERGRGASLGLLGERLVAADEKARRRLARTFQRLSMELDAPPDAKRAPVLSLTIAASHDLALTALREALGADQGLTLELTFIGSLDALEQYAEGRVDIAGFHVPTGTQHEEIRALFLRSLRTRADRLIQFVDREQGLIVPRGNPERLRTFRDIVDKQLRFVNRQRGSGTRLLIDSLLGDDGIEVGRIVGYVNEEFTHAAVAATVASGGADVGFGLRAAAAKYALAFVPQIRERYWLVVRAAALRSPPTTRLIQTLRSPIFARIVKRLPGYHAIGAGAIANIGALRSARSSR
jgi:putative molybdopterin biosynthesis protein